MEEDKEEDREEGVTCWAWACSWLLEVRMRRREEKGGAPDWHLDCDAEEVNQEGIPNGVSNEVKEDKAAAAGLRGGGEEADEEVVVDVLKEEPAGEDDGKKGEARP